MYLKLYQLFQHWPNKGEGSVMQAFMQRLFPQNRIVPLAVTTTITEEAHEGRTIVMSGAGSSRTFTLPSST